MTKETIDWTHKGIKIIDIRKLSKLYVIRVQDPLLANQIESPLFIKDVIFEERLKSYFLKDISQITREDILNVSWNMYITKGYFIKINERGDVDKFSHDLEKWYVSYLEINGALGTFCSVYRDKEIKL